MTPPATPPAPKGGAKAPADLVSGSRLGKYEIVRRLATGGMAEIFLARVSGLPGFQKMVVIKRILPQLATKADFIEMFLDEARIAATLQHPNVVQMYDVGVVDGNYFIAMEYLHGEDVRSLMKTLLRKEEKLPIEHAINIVIGLASGLHYAHEKVGFDGRPLAIVHRDVTPQNVIVTYEGGVKLLDFGIAKASNRFGETRFGTLKGKVPYMSPEQCRGDALDRRSDIFSLGIMLYELTLGRRLYRGKSDFEILKQIVEGTVTPPSEIDPEYNPALEKIVLRALEKERDKRYQTARELQADLETLVREARLYVSPIALQQFIEQVFGQKSLDEHLRESIEHPPEEEAIDEDELVELDEQAAAAEERAVRERAAFAAQIASSSHGAPAGAPTLAEDHAAAPIGGRPRRALPVALAVCGVLMLGGVAAWKLRPRSPAMLEVPAPRPTIPTPTPTPPPSIPKVAPAPSAQQAAPVEKPAPVDEHHPHHPAHPRATHHPTGSNAAKHGAGHEAERAAPLTGEGTLLLATSPWCNVRVDGQDRGPTPLSLKLPAGRHVLELINPEFKINRTLPVTIQPNQTLRKRLDFGQ